MHRIKQKLNSRSGITALFAIIIFAVAALVSVTIVTAALNNINRVKGQQAQQGEMLATDSAVALLREAFGGMKVTITEIVPGSGSSVAASTSYEIDPGHGSVETLGISLAGKMYEGAFSDWKLSLSVAGHEPLNRTASASYDGSRLYMSIAGETAEDGAESPPVTLTFDGANVQELSRIPTYRYVYDAKGRIISIVIDYWTVTSQVSLNVDQIHAEER